MHSNIQIPDISNTLQIRGFQFSVVEPGWYFDNHYHHYYELLYCVNGQVTQWLEESPISFSAGDWLLIPPAVRHKTLTRDQETFSYISLLFEIDDPEFRLELKKLSGMMISADDATHSILPELLSKLDLLLQRYELFLIQQEPLNRIPSNVLLKLELQGYFLLILSNVISLLQKDANCSNTGKTANAFEVDLANQMQQLIIGSLYKPELSVQMITNQLGISRSRSTKLFTKVFGISPRQYITSKRLLSAKEMLTESNHTIEAIAEELGFSSLSHFSRQFKNWTGLSPTQYRPQHRTLSYSSLTK